MTLHGTPGGNPHPDSLVSHTSTTRSNLGNQLIADSDRERACWVLKLAFADGRLPDATELGRRTDLALKARTRNEIDVALADLPKLVLIPDPTRTCRSTRLGAR